LHFFLLCHDCKKGWCCGDEVCFAVVLILF
jgi:hypothetical protein